jgi:hypothetical protein
MALIHRSVTMGAGPRICNDRVHAIEPVHVRKANGGRAKFGIGVHFALELLPELLEIFPDLSLDWIGSGRKTQEQIWTSFKPLLEIAAQRPRPLGLAIL